MITAGDVITDIVTRFFVYGGITEGIDTTAVEDGPEIEKLVFNYVPASQAFDEIAELAGMSYIDYEKALHPKPEHCPRSLTQVGGPEHPRRSGTADRAGGHGTDRIPDGYRRRRRIRRS